MNHEQIELAKDDGENRTMRTNDFVSDFVQSS